MGYYSTFNLKLSHIDGSKVSRSTFKEVVDDLDTMEIIGYTLDENLDSEDSGKWYSYKEDMCFVSSRHPGVLFTLKVEGEESGDLSLQYFFEGKHHQSPAMITFEPFDPNKLSDVSFKDVEDKFKGCLKDLEEQRRINEEKQKVLSKLSDQERSLLGL